MIVSLDVQESQYFVSYVPTEKTKTLSENGWKNAPPTSAMESVKFILSRLIETFTDQISPVQNCHYQACFDLSCPVPTCPVLTPPVLPKPHLSWPNMFSPDLCLGMSYPDWINPNKTYPSQTLNCPDSILPPENLIVQYRQQSGTFHLAK